MGESLTKGINVRISGDGMEAYLSLSPQSVEDSFNITEVMSYIRAQKVTYGIDEEAVKKLLEAQAYGQEICIARGVRPENGEDGEYTYNFDATMSKKPKIRSDGSVDYWSIHAVELVNEGQVIATYKPPTEEKDGMSVRGQRIPAKKGKPLPPLAGKGFTASADGTTYTASISGKIEVVNGQVRISEIYEIPGDVGLGTGNIDYHGDVVIHGGIVSGAVVKATGSITVDGVCENCTIEAGKDIVLRSGVLGDNRAFIKSKGNIHAKFFQYCKIQATGYIEADYVFDCRMVCYDRIFLSGKKGSITGGYTYATSGIVLNILGNPSEVRTLIHVGVTQDILREQAESQKMLNEANDTIRKITVGLAQYEEAAAERGIDISQDPRRVALLRTKMTKSAEVASLQKALKRVEIVVEKSKGATVSVIKDVYPGVAVTIDQSRLGVKEQQTSVQFKRREENVIMLSLADSVV
ncbi:MAG: FapA family protein [Lachnospiraceae bacterium]|nr:FapA family protein [Lachnospiraceae bacterium]